MRLTLLLLIATLLAATVWYLIDGVKSPVEVAFPGVSIGSDDTMALTDIKLVEKKNNINRVELFAKKASIRSDGESADLEDFALHSRVDKKRRLVVVAKNGLVNTKSMDVSVFGGALVHDESGNALLTDNLQMDNTKKIVSTDGDVRIYGKNFVLSGKGLFFDIKKERVELLSSVTAVFSGGSGAE